MGARFAMVVLLVLLAVLQVQLWTGRGSIPDVHQMREKLAALHTANTQTQIANEQLRSEVADLKNGRDMIEEKARMELGMVKPGEIFVQVTDK
ncbi:MAG: Cell division protein DivIC (FtsB), stabilizes FtsL against RasP cleavage [Burkholderiaceae bacterium]|jgi:cell division protein FtsB|nr:MAG: Cell division protein DivIC (FtsB), stabilizes FtsL against RasP cleavage [Burkholderiaceae bacterium]